jgi:putative PIN family toxin of toxin-antitoxin system
MTLRVVLDTNIVVSALLKPQGLEDQVLRLALSGHLQLFASPLVLVEYALVLPRPKLKLTQAEVRQTLDELCAASAIVRPTHVLSESLHEADNRFLECAEAAAADFLVTGKTEHFPKSWKATKIVNARRFLDVLASL